MLRPRQRSFLSSMAHGIEPTVFIGKNGFTPAVAEQLKRELNNHELVKLKFVDLKDEKHGVSVELADYLGAELVRVIGNVAVFYKESEIPEKRRISLP